MKEMKLHPYDGIDRRYRHTDADRAKGLEIVGYILGLPNPPSSDGLHYDLQLYSGGSGVLDRLAIGIPADADLWAAVALALTACEPEDAANDEDWAEAFLWLIVGDDQPAPLRAAVVKFVNGERQPFQQDCTLGSRVLFQNQSDVNDWAVIWGNETHLNYLGYSQG